MRRAKWVWHLECIGRKEVQSWNYRSNLKDRESLVDLGIDVRIVLKFILTKNIGNCGLDSFGTRQSQ